MFISCQFADTMPSLNFHVVPISMLNTSLNAGLSACPVHHFIGGLLIFFCIVTTAARPKNPMTITPVSTAIRVTPSQVLTQTPKGATVVNTAGVSRVWLSFLIIFSFFFFLIPFVIPLMRSYAFAHT